MRAITSEKIPTPAGHYSPAIEHNGLLFLSGQLPIDPQSKAVPESVEAQVRLALSNLRNVLIAAGSDLEHVLQVRVYIADIEQWGAVNAAYAEVFGEHRPARAVIPCGSLHFGCLLEVEATAVVP
jgi:reactive intermediate/imine deaminase